MKKSNIPQGHKRFTIAQENIVKFLDKQPDKTALNSEIANAVGKRTGHISSTLTVLEEKEIITRPERNVSKLNRKPFRP